MTKSPLILIVDDIEYNIILLDQILCNAGYRVVSALSGKKCFELLETQIPDIILLDVIMPDMNGFDITDKLKSNEKTKDIPIIYLSAISDYETKLIGLEKGAVDYVTKPYDEREVIARVQIHLKIKDLEKEKVEHIKRLEELNREKDNLLQVIAHDMRSPLTSIMLMAEFLIGYKKEMDLEKLHVYSNTIFNSSKKIIHLINRLLQASKIESSRNEITRFDLVKAIQHVSDLLSKMLENKSIRLESDYFAPEIMVDLDESKFDQILNNLLYNAIKFTNTNGLIKVCVETITKDNSNVLHLVIKDNGIGIPDEIKKDIFSKKLHIHRVGTGGEEGSGLGLSITKTLVNNLNGIIEIESQEKKGTTVHLYFYNY